MVLRPEESLGEVVWKNFKCSESSVLIFVHCFNINNTSVQDQFRCNNISMPNCFESWSLLSKPFHVCIWLPCLLERCFFDTKRPVFDWVRTAAIASPASCISCQVFMINRCICSTRLLTFVTMSVGKRIIGLGTQLWHVLNR